MGVDASRVKMALQRRVLQSRPMYANVNELLDAAFREQREQVGKTRMQGILAYSDTFFEKWYFKLY